MELLFRRKGEGGQIYIVKIKLCLKNHQYHHSWLELLPSRSTSLGLGNRRLIQKCYFGLLRWKARSAVYDIISQLKFRPSTGCKGLITLTCLTRARQFRTNELIIQVHICKSQARSKQGTRMKRKVDFIGTVLQLQQLKPLSKLDQSSLWSPTWRGRERCSSFE